MKFKKAFSMFAIFMRKNLMKSRVLNVVLIISLLMGTVIIASAQGGDDTPTFLPGARPRVRGAGTHAPGPLCVRVPGA
jgi:hypothetical protein